METTMEAPTAWPPMPFPRTATIRELYMPAMSIIDPVEAQVYLDALVARMVNHFDHSPTEATQLARKNLLAVAEQLGEEVVTRVGRLFTETRIMVPAPVTQQTMLFDLPEEPPSEVAGSVDVNVHIPIYRNFYFEVVPQGPLPMNYKTWEEWACDHWLSLIEDLDEGESEEIEVPSEGDNSRLVKCQVFMHCRDQWEDAGEPEIYAKNNDTGEEATSY